MRVEDDGRTEPALPGAGIGMVPETSQPKSARNAAKAFGNLPSMMLPSWVTQDPA
jgi:hypothetical protein